MPDLSPEREEEKSMKCNSMIMQTGVQVQAKQGARQDLESRRTWVSRRTDINVTSIFKGFLFLLLLATEPFFRNLILKPSIENKYRAILSPALWFPWCPPRNFYRSPQASSGHGLKLPVLISASLLNTQSNRVFTIDEGWLFPLS